MLLNDTLLKILNCLVTAAREYSVYDHTLCFMQIFVTA